VHHAELTGVELEGDTAVVDDDLVATRLERQSIANALASGDGRSINTRRSVAMQAQSEQRNLSLSFPLPLSCVLPNLRVLRTMTQPFEESPPLDVTIGSEQRDPQVVLGIGVRHETLRALKMLDGGVVVARVEGLPSRLEGLGREHAWAGNVLGASAWVDR
jgi:hypothetical protein